MENKKNNYKKPAMQVVEVQSHGLLQDPQSPGGSGGNPGGAREQHGSWSSED